MEQPSEFEVELLLLSNDMEQRQSEETQIIDTMSTVKVKMSDIQLYVCKRFFVLQILDKCSNIGITFKYDDVYNVIDTYLFHDINIAIKKLTKNTTKEKTKNIVRQNQGLFNKIGKDTRHRDEIMTGFSRDKQRQKFYS